LCLPAPVRAETVVLQEVRHWSQNGVTRIAVQLSGNAEFRQVRLSKPERYFFDFESAVLLSKGMQTIQVGDQMVRQIRMGEAKPGVARVVLDLVDKADVVTSELANPYRLMIEVRKPGFTPPAAPEAVAQPPRQEPEAKPVKTVRSFVPPPEPQARILVAASLSVPPSIPPPRKVRLSTLPHLPRITFPPYRTAAPPVTAQTAKSTVPLPPAPPAAGPAAQAARRGATGTNSLTRALGLKIRRVMLDPGHGGHDQGSSGPTGLLEKELVLDVAQRLGQLISEKLGSEVVYTRHDDRFVPLEARTKLANESKADLFVSIHANSSTIRSASGVETYFLSFTTSKEALDVAARENATSERSVFELREMLQKIALQEKIDESRDFATRVNASLFRVWGATGAARNRGVKKAPFVVLIGASMPSILTEIGFLSNPRDEKELRKPETRQKIAEALYKGISQYANSLSHFAVARRSNQE
jgi:N-acetylmuramoyl-L-alanine amidase